jgi:DNA-binding CsgD family transcriptional regulator
MATGHGVEELVGRERELAELDTFLDRAASGPEFLLLEGEPGIGKTSLWRAGVESARERAFRVLTARPAEAEASLSFAALGDLFAETVDAIGALPEPQRRALRVALLLEAQSGGAIDSRTLSVALLGLLRRLGEETPVLIAVDDVQWLDPPTVGALRFALRRLHAEPVSILGTFRPGPLALTAEAIEVVRVGPLDDSATQAVVRRALDAPPPRAVLRRLGDASGGNPFYALELARAFRREGRHLEPTDPLPIPTNLGELLRDRLTALPAASRRALSAAAALAQPTRDLVAGAVGDDVEGLDDAVAAGIVEVDDGAIRFTHPLLAAAVYGETDLQPRRELHRRLAGVVGDPEERTRHLALAVEPPDAEVADALEDAAERAFQRGATESAAQLIEHALRFTPAESADALHRRRLAGVGYLARTGAKTRARELLDEARLAASPGPDRARIALTATWFGVWDAASCIEALRSAVEDAREDPLLLVKVHSALVPMLLYATDVAGAALHAAQAAELAEQLKDSGHLVLALVGVAHVAFLTGKGIDFERLERAIELESVAGNPYGNVTVAQSLLADQFLIVGELDKARRILEDKAAEERRRGDMGIVWTLQELARVDVRAGEWQRAETLAREALMIAREVDDVLQEALAHRALAAAAALRGEVGRAREIAAEGLRLADRAATPLTRADLACTLGFLELSLDNYVTALSELEQVVQLVADTGIRDPSLLPFHGDYVEALIAVGDLDQAGEMTNALLADAARLDRKVALIIGARCRAQVAVARGDLADGVATLAKTRTAAAQLGQPFEFARTLFVEGTALRRARRIAEARDTLQQASAIFEQLGAALWAKRAGRELARIGGRPSQTRELTGTEQQIADLVARGKSNREVAQMLHVSPKTVEWNLSKVYKKLRVASRTELAAKLAQRAD